MDEGTSCFAAVNPFLTLRAGLLSINQNRFLISGLWEIYCKTIKKMSTGRAIKSQNIAYQWPKRKSKQTTTDSAYVTNQLKAKQTIPSYLTRRSQNLPNTLVRHRTGQSTKKYRNEQPQDPTKITNITRHTTWPQYIQNKQSTNREQCK